MSTIENILTEHLDIWTSTIKSKSSAGRGAGKKQEFYGIKKLRELILELAVRGLLVPQDPQDEPASNILKKIDIQREQSIRKGELKKSKSLQPVYKKETPFKLPKMWEWCRLGDLGQIGSSSRVHKKDWTDNGVPFYRAREIIVLSKSGHVDSELFITEELFERLSKDSLVPEEYDLMITGVGSIGVPYIVKSTDHFYFKDASVLIFKNIYRQYSRYIHMILTSPYWIKKIHEDSMGTTVHTLTISRANIVLIPIPPSAEQHRIVAKVDELMALCDKLEQQQEYSQSTHAALVETLLAALTNAGDHRSFNEAWQRISANFDILFTTESSIDQLKQTILQLAIMGKLVEQNPEDEPAEELLKRRAAIKIDNTGNKIVKNKKNLTAIRLDQIPFEIPRGWTWAWLSDVTFFQEGPGIMAKDFRDSGVPLIRISGMHSTSVSLEGCNFLDEAMVEKKWSHFRLDMGDIILSSSASLGKVSKVGEETVGSILYTGLIRFRPFKSLSSRFLTKFFESNEFARQINKSKTGSAIKHFGPSHLKVMLVPLPPLAEQHRIVAKVDELMALCDRLKASLQRAETAQLQLADSLVEKAIQ